MIVLALMLVAVMAAPAFAAEERGSVAYGAKVSLIAAPSHAFIVFENLTNSSYIVGSYEVGYMETITIGLFQATEHSGIWYNLELYNIENAAAYGTSVSIHMYIEYLDLEATVED